MVLNYNLMDYGMNNEAEMRDIFNKLNIQNQANLISHARKFQVIHKEKKNEKAVISNGNTGLYAGIRDSGTRPNGDF
jgi:hypothetical protein